jgi:hypothetical protein
MHTNIWEIITAIFTALVPISGWVAYLIYRCKRKKQDGPLLDIGWNHAMLVTKLAIHVGYLVRATWEKTGGGWEAPLIDEIPGSGRLPPRIKASICVKCSLHRSFRRSAGPGKIPGV